jgi:hypothetical protein
MSATPSHRLLIRAAVALCAGGLASAPRAARAEETTPPPPPAATSEAGFAPSAMPGGTFGTTGEWVLSMESYSPGSATPSFFIAKQSGGGTSFLVRPGLDYFLGDSISVGGSIGVGYGGGNTTVSLGARAGFNMNIAGHVGFWPTAGMVGSYTSGNGTSSSAAALVVFAPFLYHPAPHFFLGAGPFLGQGVYGGTGTQYGLDFVIGGWL